MWNWSACAYNEIFPPISWQLSNSWWQGAWENRSPLLPPTAPDRTGRDKQGPHSAGYPEPSKHPYTAQHHREPFAPTALCHLLQIQGNPHLRGHFCAAHHCVPRAVARLAPTLPSAIAIAFIYFLNYTVFPAPLNLIKLWPKILSQRREQKKCFCARTSITVILIITRKKPSKVLKHFRDGMQEFRLLGWVRQSTVSLQPFGSAPETGSVQLGTPGSCSRAGVSLGIALSWQTLVEVMHW